MRSNIAVQDMFGNQEVEKYNANPVKGKKYLAFTILMVIILSVVVIRNAHSTSLASIANSKIKDDQSQPLQNSTAPINNTSSSTTITNPSTSGDSSSGSTTTTTGDASTKTTTPSSDDKSTAPAGDASKPADSTTKDSGDSSKASTTTDDKSATTTDDKTKEEAS